MGWVRSLCLLGLLADQAIHVLVLQFIITYTLYILSQAGTFCHTCSYAVVNPGQEYIPL